MSVGDVAGLIAAVAFGALVGFLALPLVKLGKVFDAATQSVKDVTEHTLPVIDETAATIAGTNAQLAKVDTVTTAAAEITQNASALTALVAATVGRPLIRLAAFSYGVRTALGGFAQKVTGKGSGKAQA
ncbi:DUF948 domain-containing protein [Actinotalea fermentans]|uniref:DUF948 domain-containing protein n=1 Tax=Actinotalea fermentans TaxID=43671 RepID=A0A511YUH0_9CELL|nr:DUF948 domain-containing protein [Actinotalea fermentans]KGM15909.1 hypothetical protein N867_04630 [Actinotalea fermentans ATCC 43279 = JCM 9966 = DSM 3133]GEN78839.1 hypothetical protein AFE02nite_05730 [Actinotalea fermentans]